MTNKLKEEVLVSRGLLWLIGGISPITFLVAIFWMGAKYNNIETRLFDSTRQKEHVINRVDDQTIHMPFTEKIKVFVPRSEMNYIIDDISEIKDDMKDIKKALRIKE